QRRAAVAEVVGGRGVRIAVLGETDEVRVRTVLAGGGDCPVFDVALEVVRGGLVEGRVGGVAVPLRDRRGGGQTRDLGGDRRDRVPRLLLPALDAEGRSVRDQEVR